MNDANSPTTDNLDPKLLAKRARDAAYRRRKRIERDNAAFNAMTPAQKRVQIAKDVLNHLDTRQLVAQSGAYISRVEYNVGGLKPYTEDYYRARERVQYSPDARKELLDGKVTCAVCAIGSVFVCAVERKNEISMYDVVNAGKTRMTAYLKDFFSLEQLDLMEVAFEGGPTCCESARYRPMERCSLPGCENTTCTVRGTPTPEAQVELDAAQRLYSQLAGDDDAIMRAIMQNIIDNCGEFRP